MEHTLKLTITAVGESGSVFLTPCDPVTLHESAVERPDDEEAVDGEETPVRGDGLPRTQQDEDLMVFVD